MLSVITIGVPPEFQLGPVTVAWHGLTIAVGIVLGGAIASRRLRRQGLDAERITALGLLLTVSALVGARLFYVLEHGGPLLGTRGFTFDGGFILAAVTLAFYVRRERLSARYLDAVAFALPLGVAIGRVGDVINGEHYGDPSRFLLAVRNANPDALTPDPLLAYQNGGLYEVLLGLVVFAAVLVFTRWDRQSGDLAWFVLGAFSVGRFFVFFLRSDSPELALGLSNAQWTSALLVVLVAGGWAYTRRRGPSTLQQSTGG